MKPRADTAAPAGTTKRGPNLSIKIPNIGARKEYPKKPTEKAAATVPRLQPNSSNIGGNNKEKVVLALRPTPIVIKPTATITQP